jgi:hypothetical protein
VPPTNPISPSRNELLVQGIDGGGPPHCVLLPSWIDGVDTEGNAPVPTLEIINMLNTAPVGIQEVATNPMPPSQCQVRRLGGGIYVIQASWSMEDHGSVRRVSLGGR